MSNVGINIWLLGDALKNPELGGAQPTVVDGDFSLGHLKVQGGDDYAEAVFSLGPIHVDGQENWGRGDFTLGELQLLGGDDYAAADYTLGPIKILADGEDDPGLEGGALTFIGLTVQGAGYTWGTGTGDVQLGELELLGSDYDYGTGDYSLGPIRISANGTEQFLQGLVWLPGLQGFLSNLQLDETLGVSSTEDITVEMVLRVYAQINAAHSPITQTYTLDVSEELFVQVAKTIPTTLYIVEQLAATDDYTLIVTKIVDILEQLSATANHDALAAYRLSFAHSLLVVGTHTAIDEITVEEVLETAIQQPMQMTYLVTMLEALAAEHSGDFLATFMLEADESIEATQTSDFIGFFKMSIEEGIELFVSVQLGDEVIQGWVLNTQTMGFSEYTNYPFNSLAEANGQYYGLSRDGLYKLDGDDDAGEPIEAVVRTGLVDMGSHYLKMATAAYVGYTTTDQMVLKVVTTDQGQKEEWWYELRPTTADDMRDGRVPIGRGLRARYWQFEVVNADGADFDVDDVTLLYQVLNRRIR